MMSKLKISMCTCKLLNIQTDPWTLARTGARQQLDYWGGCTMQAFGWLDISWVHHGIHFWKVIGGFSLKTLGRQPHGIAK